MTLLDRAIAALLPTVPKSIVRKVASRYIAGETAGDALRVARQLNDRGIRATMDILGEDVHTVEQAKRPAEHYVALLQSIHDQRIDSNVSIKLSQLGLKVNLDLCLELAGKVVEHARELGNFVRIDMEDSSCTTDTLFVYRSLRAHYSNVGVAIQAYLRRTMADVSSLETIKPNFRLCKGVYVEPRTIAYRDMRIINRNYVAILRHLFEIQSYVGIATHDELIVWEAMNLIRELKAPPSAYEFQMLLGVDEELRDIILAQGHHLRVYIPFGGDWYKYSVRRLRENPRIAGYVLKAMLKK